MERRIAVARMVGKLLASAEGRQYFRDNAYTSDQAIVTADYDELIKDVLPRIHSHKPPVTVALIKGDELCLFNIEPTSETLGKFSPASANSTIGMLYEASRQPALGTTFQLTDWDRAKATSMPSVRQLLTA